MLPATFFLIAKGMKFVILGEKKSANHIIKHALAGLVVDSADVQRQDSIHLD